MSHQSVGIHEAKTHLSRLLRRVADGEEIVLTRGGHPVARLVPYVSENDVASSFGLYAGQFTLGDDFDADEALIADDFGIPR